jgi:dipeptidyl aminopeptidase/acylaminoacyl peptidase
MSFDLDTFLTLPRVSGLALSPDGSRLVTSVSTVASDGTKFQSALSQFDPAGEAAPRRLTRSAKGETGAAFLPDGSLVFTSARPDRRQEGRRPRRPGGLAANLIAIDIATGERRTLADGDVGYWGVRCSPDGRSAVGVFETLGDPDHASHQTLWLVDLATGQGRDLTPDLDLWPHDPVWAPDSSAVYFVADQAGRAPAFRGYGQAFVERGRGRWGDEPFTDLMAATDAAVARNDIDGGSTAAMGGSFGGYMANWVAGHTDRFRCLVTHASLWALDQFHGTTDHAAWWEREFGEALRLWVDLMRHGVEAKFLYFPDENHWILKPQHARVWYDTVLAWLDHHLLGKEWQRPEIL